MTLIWGLGGAGGGLCPGLLPPLEGEQLGSVLIVPIVAYPSCCCPLQACGKGTGAMKHDEEVAELMHTLASPVPRYSPLAEQFSHQFPSHDLPSVLAKFSLPVSLSEFRNPLAPPVQEVSRRSLGALEPPN